MSSTRHAKDDSAYHQNSYASSREFERGLLANMVAKRCALLDAPADRELLWFIQHLSHKPGGLAALVDDLLKKFAHRIGTPAMVRLSSRQSVYYTADEVLEVRRELPAEICRRFPLQGESKAQTTAGAGTKLRRQSDRNLELQRLADEAMAQEESWERQAREQREAKERDEAKKNPVTYPVSAFHAICLQAATKKREDGQGLRPLEREISDLCLDPELNLASGGPWYFDALVDVLREYQQQWITENSKVVTTELGAMICAELDFTLHSGSMSLIEGNARMGKSFAARAWCEQHPGRARFVEVSTGNDETSFFRDIARGLGLGNFLNYKTIQIRERVESVLRTGDLVLVLDEAQRLWPQRNLRYGYPSRVVWVMAMKNAGVPICLIATNQFLEIQKAVEKSGWNSTQLKGRLGHYQPLPADLSEADLMAVAKSVLPEADKESLAALAAYARASERYLASIEATAKRARYNAQRAGRNECTKADIRTAMKETVIPSDTLLKLAMAPKAHGRASAPQSIQPVEQPTRATRPLAPAAGVFHQRAGSAIELAEA